MDQEKSAQGHDAICEPSSLPSIDLVVRGRERDLGGLVVRRVLPSMLRRLVGPFIFLDHMGPTIHAPGQGIDVRPHPHIHLATVTYLFEGEIQHKDSLGNDQAIRPGEVNWMTAGHGIVHSERTSPQVRARGGALHGLQAWVVSPTSREEDPPTFRHYDAAALPSVTRPGARISVVVGSAYGVTSPVETTMPTLYVDARLEPGAEIVVPHDVSEVGAYIVEGEVECEEALFAEGTLLVMRRGACPTLRALRASRVVLLGGDPPDGPRFIFWNFVSSSKENIEQAKIDWKEDRVERFPKVPGDEKERIELPS